LLDGIKRLLKLRSLLKLLRQKLAASAWIVELAKCGS
jgi:hypothetical protein